ncbi:MAG: metallophosphatase [Proteobacteria bacterium]|nr:metallophosphatase [Pseudomonadota bacterium]MCP4921650.1 metallophosphatase [Pseudomonadota bacterium]
MSTLYVGDVHGCSDELEQLIREADAERVVLVGDLFSKGPDADGVWALIQEHGLAAVLGNHDAWQLAHTDLDDDRRVWLQGLPLFLDDGERIVVHAGLHPVEGVLGTTREMALTMRTFAGSPWTEQWAGPACVVYGHDARRGLVQHDVGGRRVAMGLDTGCVYGGRLTGWLADEDRVLSIPARRVYRPIT